MSPFPKHLTNTQDNRQAVAPYNFVELPDRIVTVNLNDCPDRDRYHNKYFTGHIDCTLTTSSPLFIRCGLTLQQFVAEKEAKDQSEFFYTNPENLHPVLPGSSLRGMLRTLVEIASFSKITQIANVKRFFFRAVADSKTSVGKHYQDRLGLGTRLSNVRAGYLKKEGNQWKIRPAKIIEGKYPFVWVKERLLLTLPPSSRVIPEYVKMGSPNNRPYQPQYYPNIHFGNLRPDNGRQFADLVSRNDTKLPHKGALVTSGDMSETGSGGTTNRRNHCLIGEQDISEKLLKICPNAIQDYCNSLTEFQQSPPFDPKWGILQQGSWIFYVKPDGNNPVELFGHSPNFRIPFSWRGTGEAAKIWDFVPPSVRDLSLIERERLTPEEECKDDSQIDLAKAIFGFVRQDKLKDDSKQARAGRIFISDGEYQSAIDGLWYSDRATIPKILSEPRPSTYSHYLVQKDQVSRSDNSSHLERDAAMNLQHYANQPKTETVIRGHKLYWHQGTSPNFIHPNPNDAIENQSTQVTQIRPVKAGVTFTFKIDFENLSSVELGALLWVLDIAQNDRYRLSLGMGKPLGMGAVKIESTLHFSDRASRYTNLFNDDKSNWYLGESHKPSFDHYISEFKDEIVRQLHTTLPFEEVRRIKMLLALLSWENELTPEQLSKRRYLEIKRPSNQNPMVLKLKLNAKTENEFAERRVLPTPLQVISVDDDLDKEIDSALSDRQVEIRQALKESGLTEEDVVTVKIAKIDGKEVTVKIASQKLKKKNKRASQWSVGQSINIRITKLQDDGIIKGFEFLDG
jgi:CRISPR-associated protein (TIGR03986 family)